MNAGTDIAASASEADENQLVARCQQGDTTAFDQLVTRYRQRAFAMVYQIVRNEQDAWDVAQEGFLKAWKAMPRFKTDATFFTWLYRIMTNAAIDWLRRKANRPTSEYEDGIAAEEGGDSLGPPVPPPDLELHRAEIGRRIEVAMGKLSPEHRAAITLKEIEGLSYAEIAESMDCSIGTVMSRIHYARKHLQSLLSDLHHE